MILARNLGLMRISRPLVEQDGYEQDYNYLSGGEKTSLALAYRLSLNTIVQKVSAGIKSNLLILDEPTDGFQQRTTVQDQGDT